MFFAFRFIHPYADAIEDMFFFHNAWIFTIEMMLLSILQQ